MTTIYTAILEKFKAEHPEFYVDLDCNQLDGNERPPIALPAALISISVTPLKNITDTIQECKAKIKVRLVFNPIGRTASNTPTVELTKSLDVYTKIADVYAMLQGFYTQNFDSLSRTNQGKEKSRHGYFQYAIDFECEFEDDTADG
jgi:hypothetical protein